MVSAQCVTDRVVILRRSISRVDVEMARAGHVKAYCLTSTGSELSSSQTMRTDKGLGAGLDQPD